MKDAKGHGSNPRGAHNQGIEAATSDRLYTMMYRPAGYATLPSKLGWEYVETPKRNDLGINRPDLPQSREHPFGVIRTERELTPEEVQSFELRKL